MGHWALGIGHWALLVTRNQETAVPFPYQLFWGRETVLPCRPFLITFPLFLFPSS